MNHRGSFLHDVLAGLVASQKFIPGKYLWDAEGSRIFEAITATAEYYQDGAEFALTRQALPDIATQVGTRANIIEFGSGASRKIRQVLDALENPARWYGTERMSDKLH